ncbi:MAG: uracil-DNA glycosylase [Blastocatellia bacterium]|jgi:DNA polymerase|nr:uracil-DNA glycosylase [Blastocatellia bacterium]
MKPDPTARELLDLLEQSREHARYFAELGVETIALSNERISAVSPTPLPASRLAQPSTQRRDLTASERSSSMKPAAVTISSPMPPASLFGERAAAQFSSTESTESMEDVWRDIGDCTRCGLCEGRTQVVNTFGNHKARLMFVGEAPGAEEDAQGKPFVGRAGQLLTKIIEAIGMKREEVLIGNVNRCRPPGNRQPTLEEAAICRPFLFREIAAVQPDVIVVMGNTALRNLLEVREGITRVRGKFQDFRGIKVMPTFHPAYLLRDPSKKRETWEDLKKVRDYLDNLPTERD